MAGLPPPGPGCEACAARDAVIAEQAGAIAELQQKVARLERAVFRNSGNSSMPPSTDDLPGRKPPSWEQRRTARRATRKRSQGKQPGAPASAMCRTEPDEVIDHHPQGRCGSCGADLAGAVDLGVAASAQQLEAPLMTAGRACRAPR